MDIITTQGTTTNVVVPFISMTMDKKDKEFKDQGKITFKETVINHGGWYFGAVECVDFELKFFNYYPVKVNPEIKTAYAAASYYNLRLWIDSVVDSVSHQLLAEHPQSSMYKADGSFEAEPPVEMKKKAFDLFVQAKPSDVNVDRTPRVVAADSESKYQVKGKGKNKRLVDKNKHVVEQK